MPDCPTMLAAAEVCSEEYALMLEDHENEEEDKLLECIDLWLAYNQQCYYGMAAAAKKPKKKSKAPCSDCGQERSRKMLDAMTPAERALWGPGRKASKKRRYEVIRKYLDKAK